MSENRPTNEFGQKVRELRKTSGISLRRFAQEVGMSPTYLSKVERGEFPPPSEQKIRAIATRLNLNEDVLLALADKVAQDLTAIIRRVPREMADFLRAANGLPPEELVSLTKEAEKRSRKQESQQSSRCAGGSSHTTPPRKERKEEA